MRTRTLLIPILAVALAQLVFASPGGAQTAPAIIAQSMLDRGDDQAFTLSGRVQSVDFVENIIVLRVRGDVYTVSVTPTTSVEVGGQSGSIADLKAGAHVRIRGTIRDGEMIAESISVK